VRASVLYGTCDDGRPADEVNTVLVIQRPGDGPKETWVRQWGGTELDRWPLPDGFEARIVTGGGGPP
jgi:hypothetical protein